MTVMAAILLFGQGIVSAQKEPGHGEVPLPVPLQRLALAIGVSDPHPATLLLQAIRLAYDTPDTKARRVRDALNDVLGGTVEKTADVVPLPLGPAVWQDAILQTPTGIEGVVPAILMDRRAALLYIGLAALDDETLAWLGTDRDTLLHLKRHAAVFAAFGRSVHVRGGHVSVPGGSEAEPLWKTLTGADPGKPAVFVQRIISGEGRLAFLYDTIAHLDESRQRFALGLQGRSSLRDDRLRMLLETFTAAAPDWRVDERPFARPPLDGSILLSTVRVTPQGAGAAPVALRIWERVFRGDELTDVPFQKVSDAEVRGVSEYLNVDAAWLASRTLRVPYALGRRRLDTFLFAQRVFGDRPASEAAVIATALRGYLAFPSLMISLEQSGIRNPTTFAQASEHAARLNAIDSLPLRRTSIAEFQSAVALIQRTRRTGALTVQHAEALLSLLTSLEVSPRTAYESRFSRWLRDQFLRGLAARSSDEETVLTAMSGPVRAPDALPVIEWEGRQYRVDPGFAELRRLRLVRQRQGGPALDGALAMAVRGETEGGRREAAGVEAERSLADTLMSIVYAAHVGDPEGAAVTSGNVALRHDFGITASSTDNSLADPWRLPIEHFDGKAAWRIRGSILGLEAALGRLALRRQDPTVMPAEPKVGPQDRQTVMLTAALLNPFDMTDGARDAVAAAIARGRARVAALSDDPSKLDEVVRAGGLSEWRHQAVKWSLARGHLVLPQFSLLELFWIGSPDPNAIDGVDPWGAATLPLTGCLCLEMPHPGAWEDLGGHPVAVLATRGADVNLAIAETLAALKLPASLAAALGGYVTQDVIEHAQLAYPDDWQEFGRAARELPRERMFDYIAALTAGGALVPVEK